eukprot:806378-Pleurochrysis_carterae.AAC.1
MLRICARIMCVHTHAACRCTGGVRMHGVRVHACCGRMNGARAYAAARTRTRGARARACRRCTHGMRVEGLRARVHAAWRTHARCGRMRDAQGRRIRGRARVLRTRALCA